MKYLWCYELPPLEKVASLIFIFSQSNVITDGILIGFKSRQLSSLRDLMLVTGIPTQIPQSDVITSCFKHVANLYPSQTVKSLLSNPTFLVKDSNLRIFNLRQCKTGFENWQNMLSLKSYLISYMSREILTQTRILSPLIRM